MNVQASHNDNRVDSKKEETAIVLDYLPNGYSNSSVPAHRKTAIAQAIGKKYLVLLELVPKKECFLNPGEEVYIGEGKRDKVHHINGKIELDKLTNTASNELKFTILDIVKKNEAQFIEFFNKSGPLSLRMHQLELLPGLGKKHMKEILDAREETPFTGFEDLKKRVKLMPNPEEIVVKRILKEIEGLEKHRIFVKG
jgi:putative nucleotide binding protein